jgi:hypothetical protein
MGLRKCRNAFASDPFKAFGQWVPDAAMGKKIMVDNPTKFYG